MVTMSGCSNGTVVVVGTWRYLSYGLRVQFLLDYFTRNGVVPISSVYPPLTAAFIPENEILF